MHRGAILAGLIGCGLVLCTLWAQDPFREYPAWEYNNFPLPKDYLVPGEWTFARLMYPTSHCLCRLAVHRSELRCTTGTTGHTNWTIDYPRSDRHLSLAVRRLTRIDGKSAEQPINLEQDDDVFNYPWLYAVEVGHWELTDQMVAKFREFLDRGGFFMCDDFHGTKEWEVFLHSFKKILPDREIVDIPIDDPINHTVYDINERYQVPGAQYEYPPYSICEKCRTNPTWGSGGDDPHFRGVYDDRGRLIAVMTHDNDLGDSWENADDPKYPEKFSWLGIRIGINYIVYAMTH
jgi:hypothetical protein